MLPNRAINLLVDCFDPYERISSISRTGRSAHNADIGVRSGGFGAQGRPVTIRQLFVDFVVVGEGFYGARELRKRRR